MQFCNSQCQWCARNFWNWLKSREHQMNVSKDGGTSFASAASTSVRPFSGYRTSQHCDAMAQCPPEIK